MNTLGTFLRWLPQAVFISAICFLVYITVQQDLRMTANDPQIQIAEDAAMAAGKGVSPDDIARDFGGALYDYPNAIDMAQSLRPFIMVFDQSGNILSSSASLAGEVPVPPVGVFTYTATNGEDRFTWQPIPQARIAAVLLKLPPSEIISTSTNKVPGFILAGRSLREVEKRQGNLLNQVALTWVILLVLSLGYSIYVSGRNSSTK